MNRLFLIGGLFLFGYLYGVNYDYILVVDISGSMKKGNLHERVKSAFKEYVSGVQIGDRVILMTFGDDVNSGLADVTIRGMEDIREIQDEIDRFRFNDQYTWMTKAFDVIGNRLRDLQRAFPKRPKKVLIFTDGRNEPPPGHEDEFTFDQILEKHFDTYKRENTFVYMVLLGETPQEELRNMEREGAINIIERERELPDAVQEITLFPQSFSVYSPLRDTIKQVIELSIERIVNINQEVPINLGVGESHGFQIVLSPTQFNVNRQGQRIPLTLKLIGITKTGNYSFHIYPRTSVRGIIVDPDRIVFNINVTEISVPFVKLSPTNFNLKFNLKDSLKKKIELKVEELSGINVIPIALRVDTSRYFNVRVSPEQFVAEKEGQEIPITLTISGIQSVGRYSLNLVPTPQIKNAVVQPVQIYLKMNIKKPLKIPGWVWIVIIGAIVVIGGILMYQRSIPKFDKEYLVLVNDEGEEEMRLRLKRKQSLFSSKIIISKHLRFSGLPSFSFYLRKDKKGRIYIKGLQNEVKIGDEQPIKGKEKKIEPDVIFEVKDKKFKIKRR